MDEILASIRRIIADDQALGFAGPSRRTPPQAAASYDGNNGEGEERAPQRLPAEQPEEPSYAPERPARPPKTFAEAADLPAAPRPVMREAPARPFTAQREAPMRAQATPAEPRPAPGGRDTFSDAAERLLSPKSDASVSTAFDALASSTAPQNSRSLEDVVRDMLRPMLKSWLDENLPGIVERLVRQEIERVARGQR